MKWNRGLMQPKPLDSRFASSRLQNKTQLTVGFFTPTALPLDFTALHRGDLNALRCINTVRRFTETNF